MMGKKKDQIRALLKSIETGETDAVAVVNEDKYVQHNPHTREGSEGLAQLFLRLSRTSPRVEIVRAFEDGDFVFAHTEYDFSDKNTGFEHLLTCLAATATEIPARSYTTIHRVLAEGNFVLSMCEGMLGETHCSFYDLYRLDNERLVEHWDTVDVIPPRNEWNNNNGKF